MNILIIHRYPYKKAVYANVINHDKCKVIYYGFKAALDRLPCDIKDKATLLERTQTDGFIREVETYLQNTKLVLDKIVALSEYDLIEAALLRRILGLDEVKSVEALEKVRDKTLMKKAVIEKGLRTPLMYELSDIVSQNNRELIKGDVILKPRDGAASVDVIKYDSLDSMLTAIAGKSTGIDSLDKHAKYVGYYVEEYVTGSLFHVDGVIDNGTMTSIIASEYYNTGLDFANGEPIGSYQLTENEELEQFTHQCLLAVGHTHGVFHLELIYSGDGPCFIEVGARPGGGQVIETFERATNINLANEHTKVDMHLPLTEAKPRSSNFGWFLFAGNRYANNKVEIRNIDDYTNTPFMQEYWNNKEVLKDEVNYDEVASPFAGLVEGAEGELRRFYEKMFEELDIAVCK